MTKMIRKAKSIGCSATNVITGFIYHAKKEWPENEYSDGTDVSESGSVAHANSCIILFEHLFSYFTLISFAYYYFKDPILNKSLARIQHSTFTCLLRDLLVNFSSWLLVVKENVRFLNFSNNQKLLQPYTYIYIVKCFYAVFY